LKYIKENKMNELEKLQDIIFIVLGVDVKVKSRKRRNVDAKRIFSKILRDKGYTLIDISKFLNNHHTTVMFYLKNFDFLLVLFPDIEKAYNKCLNNFLVKKETTIYNYSYQWISPFKEISNEI
tara:strand:+ start:185 stop:553 length:369 start_codon:yes stop_codon:yes gene_type:complete